MNLLGLIDPRVRQITVEGVRAYLLQHGWKLQPDPMGTALIFECPPDIDEGDFVRIIPRSENAGDYLIRLMELLSTLGTVEDRPPLDVVSDILRLQESPVPLSSGNGITATAVKAKKKRR